MTNLEAARRRAGVTQRVLAADIGCDHSTISAYEHNRSRPRGVRARRLEALFDMTIDQLLSDEGRVGGSTDAAR